MSVSFRDGTTDVEAAVVPVVDVVCLEDGEPLVRIHLQELAVDDVVVIAAVNTITVLDLQPREGGTLIQLEVVVGLDVPMLAAQVLDVLDEQARTIREGDTYLIVGQVHRLDGLAYTRIDVIQDAFAPFSVKTQPDAAVRW